MFIYVPVLKSLLPAGEVSTPSPFGRGLGRGSEQQEPPSYAPLPQPFSQGRREKSNSQFLLVPERHQRIDLRRASSWDIGSDDRNETQQQRHAGERQRVGRPDAVEEADYHAR